MIGVSARPEEADAVREFFELCKTSWEFARPNTSYSVLLSSKPDELLADSPLILLFSSERTIFDETNSIQLSIGRRSTTLLYNDDSVPIYGMVATFPGIPNAAIAEQSSGEAAICVAFNEGSTILRIGYDLFDEIKLILTDGQPVTHALTPTVELHIELLRRLITAAGEPFVEIPPVPYGRPFITCLTHDIDHPRLRNHLFDHTMAGFLYRATIGSLLDLWNERRTAADVWENLISTAKLPFFYFGFSPDPWENFDRYVQIESGCGATYFIIPVANQAGRGTDGPAPRKRASRYEPDEIAPQLRQIMQAGGEVGVHGLDAWCDEEQGRSEKEIVTRLTGSKGNGIRMHWLYFGADSPRNLERAGYVYDASFGYNEAVGYRAGTGQVYLPLGCASLLELPLQLMDTALFFSEYLHSRPCEAHSRVNALIGNALRFGGVLTINWHDRSIAPERLWENFYRELLLKLSACGAWFPTASAAVAWFRKRRGARIECEPSANGTIHVNASIATDDALPALTLRLHRAAPSIEPGYLDLRPTPFTDLKLDSATAQDFFL